jgi:DNA-binding NarL/FixJ family response regulator
MKQSDPLRVFVADDSALVRAAVVDMIDSIPGVQVVGFSENGPQALEFIRKTPPNVLVLDIRMPGKSGIEVLQEVKRNHAGVTVIMLTNYPYAPYRKKCLEAGADYFFEKAMDFDKVVTVLTDMSQQLLKSKIVEVETSKNP